MSAERRRELLAMATVAFAACCAFATAIGGAFVFDDIHSIAGNPGIRSLGNLGRFFVDPTLFSGNGSAMYRPVLLVTFALDWWLGGGAVWPFKLGNVLLHAANAVLLLRLLRAYDVRVGVATAAAVLFAVHPLTSETVNLVSARSESLLCLGLLVALLANTLAADARAAIGMAIGVFVACGSKETAVVLPPLLALQCWLRSAAGAPAPGRWRATAGRLAPALAVVVVWLGARRWLLGVATASVLGRAGGDGLLGATRDLTTQLATMGALLPRALWQMVWPTDLTIDPPVVYLRSLASPWASGGWLALLTLTAVALRHGRARPLQTLAVAMAAAVALPWIVVPLNVPLAEHRLYAPLCGCSAAAAVAIDAHLRRRLPVAGWHRWLPLTATVGVAVAFAIHSAWRSATFRDPAAVFAAALRVDPRSFRGHWGLGTVQMTRGDWPAAERSLARACALWPFFRAARANWVETLLRLPAADGWHDRALAVAAELTAQKDDDPYYRLLHARALHASGVANADPERVRAAEQRAMSCHEVGAPKAQVFLLAAECRRWLGEPAGALARLDAAVAAGLDTVPVLLQRAELLRALGRPVEAERDLRTAAARAPFDAAVQQALRGRPPATPR